MFYIIQSIRKDNNYVTPKFVWAVIYNKINIIEDILSLLFFILFYIKMEQSLKDSV